MYAEFLSFVETSPLGQLARSSAWLFPLANLGHVLGAALLLGAIVVFDLLLLRGRYNEAKAISRYALTIAGTGLVLLIVTGPVLFSAEATATGRNLVFQIKMALVVIGLANIAAYHAATRRQAAPRPSSARLHAAISAAAWTAVVLAGRSIAYW
jgi:hypothetical protein